MTAHVLAAVVILAAVIAVLSWAAWLINRPDHGRHIGHVIPGYDPEPGDEWADELHDIADDTLDRMVTAFHAAPLYVTAPAPSSPPPGDPPAGAVTSIELHHPVHRYAAAARQQQETWQAETSQLQRDRTPRYEAPAWDSDDPAFTETGWTKRSALDLAIRLAREQLDAGFDHIVDYATSGIQARWAS
jgi:hypothetical protein